MIRRWGLLVFFLMSLLLSGGAWTASYWHYAGISHAHTRTGMVVTLGSMFVFACDSGWSAPPFWSGRTDREDSVYDEPYRATRAAPWHFLGFAYNPADNHFLPESKRLLIVPLWFPTSLAALGLLWAWRRKRRRDLTQSRGFEANNTEVMP